MAQHDPLYQPGDQVHVYQYGDLVAGAAGSTGSPARPAVIERRMPYDDDDDEARYELTYTDAAGGSAIADERCLRLAAAAGAEVPLEQYVLNDGTTALRLKH